MKDIQNERFLITSLKNLIQLYFKNNKLFSKKCFKLFRKIKRLLFVKQYVLLKIL